MHGAAPAAIMSLVGLERAWGRVVAVIGAGVAIAGALDTAAVATIVPQRGMAGVRLGMTHSQVTARLGQPLAQERMGDVEFCCRYTFRGDLSTTFFDDRALAEIWTTGRAERTAEGIG